MITREIRFKIKNLIYRKIELKHEGSLSAYNVLTEGGDGSLK